MIQRIQTVYLFLVVVFSLFFLFLPLGHFMVNDSKVLIKSLGQANEYLDAAGMFVQLAGYIILAITFVVMALSVYTTLQYKRRLFQIQLGKVNILLHVIIVVITFFYIDGLKELINDTFSYGAAIFFPLLSMIMILMANRAIRKDENMVRAADRLR